MYLYGDISTKQVTTTLMELTKSYSHLNAGVTSIISQFKNARHMNVDDIVGGNGTSEPSTRIERSPDYYIIAGFAVIGVTGILSNFDVLAVLIQKKNRQLATNRYLVNLAISESVHISL